MPSNYDKPLDYNLRNTELDPMSDDLMDIEVEVVEIETTPDGVVIDGQELAVDPKEAVGHYDNLVAFIPDTEASRIAQDIIEKVHDSAEARSSWLKMYKRGAELLGINPEKKSTPWEGACNTVHPIMMEAVYSFQATTFADTFPPSGPVKVNVLGRQTPQKLEAASRVAADMNYFLTKKMREYSTEHSKALFQLGLAGQVYKKVWYDDSKQRPVSLAISPEDVIIPFHTTNVHEPEWLAHVVKRSESEVERLQEQEYLVEASEQGGAEPSYADKVKVVKRRIAGVEEDATMPSDELMWFLEFYGEFKLDGEEERRPYLMIVDLTKASLVGVFRNWKEDDPSFMQHRYFVPYVLVPAFGAMAFGYAHILGAPADAGTKMLQQLVDAGTLANLPGGFKSSAMRIKGGTDRIKPGEWKDVDVPMGAVLSQNVVPLPYKEPSQTLLLLMNTINDAGGRLAALMDAKVADVGKNETPVGTILAVLEQAMKPMSALQKRVHEALRDELELLRDVIKDHAPQDYEYDNADYSSRRADYELVEVCPVSDPGASSMAQKLAQLQVAQNLAQAAPQLYDMAMLHRRVLSTVGMQDVESLIPDKKQAPKLDPMSENVAVLQGEPVRAFVEQDHEAHIQVHSNLLQDPQLQAIMEQNPQAPQMMAAAQAHIAEHVAFEYQKQMLAALGVELPPPGTPLPIEIENALEQAMAAASAKVLQQSQTRVAAQQAQQAAQDPVLQIQMQETQNESRKLDLKDKEIEINAELKDRQLDLQAVKIEQEAKIKGLKIGVDVADKHAQRKKEGADLAAKIAGVLSKNRTQQR